MGRERKSAFVRWMIWSAGSLVRQSYRSGTRLVSMAPLQSALQRLSLWANPSAPREPPFMIDPLSAFPSGRAFPRELAPESANCRTCRARSKPLSSRTNTSLASTACIRGIRTPWLIAHVRKGVTPRGLADEHSRRFGNCHEGMSRQIHSSSARHITNRDSFICASYDLRRPVG